MRHRFVAAMGIVLAAALIACPVCAFAEPTEPMETFIDDETIEVIDDPVSGETAAPAAGETAAAAEGTVADTSGSSGVPETDPYGNPIDWDASGEQDGGEDGAGNETDADLMHSPEYTPEEQESVAAQIAPKPEKPEETGYLIVKCDLGDDWAGYNVLVKVYDKDFDLYQVYCYAQNGYEAREQLPIGHYQAYEAVVPGDRNHSYPLVLSAAEFDITENGTFELTVQRGGAAGTGGTPAWTQGGASGNNGADKQDGIAVPDSVKTDILSLIGAGLVGAACIGIGIGIGTFFKRRGRNGRYH